MFFEDFLDKDITVHTEGHKYRGVLHGIRTTERQGMSDPNILVFEMGVDLFYLDAHKVIAVTVHGREMD